jgi:hypothetical protein
VDSFARFVLTLSWLLDGLGPVIALACVICDQPSPAQFGDDLGSTASGMAMHSEPARVVA